MSRLALEEMLYSNQYSFPIPGRCKCYDRNFGFFAYLSSNVLKTCDNRCYLPLHLIFSKNCGEKHYKTTIRGRTVPLANSLATAIYSGHETSFAILEQLRQTEIKSNSHAWLEISRWECDRKRAQVTVVRVFKKNRGCIYARLRWICAYSGIGPVLGQFR